MPAVQRDLPEKGALVKCPSCKNGTTIGPNGESWRCYRCGGTGKIPDPPKEPKS